jgi:glycosyltransferase involved in cell wall biosynthesis
LVEQSLQPKQLVIVNDNSSDDTVSIVTTFSNKHPWIELVNKQSSDVHLPGSKIIQAFNTGLNTVANNYDLICKFDADLIFPSNYLESLANHFKANPKLGMAAGFCYIEKDGAWVLENLTRKDHIRGALKCYRKSCFDDIGGLRSAMGWDTVDELLAKYYGWELLTDDLLIVKHLKPTGQTYNRQAKLLQGQAMYRMRYGFWITLISGSKLALRKRKPLLVIDYIRGYFKAKVHKEPFLINEDQGRFIRKIRWQGIKQKIF